MRKPRDLETYIYIYIYIYIYWLLVIDYFDVVKSLWNNIYISLAVDWQYQIKYLSHVPSDFKWVPSSSCDLICNPKPEFSRCYIIGLSQELYIIDACCTVSTVIYFLCEQFRSCRRLNLPSFPSDASVPSLCLSTLQNFL